MTRRTLRTAAALADAGLISAAEVAQLSPVEAQYAIAVPPHVAARLEGGSKAMFSQFVPTRAELRLTDHERKDPIGDDVHSPVSGIVHRYPDRVLLKPVHVCPVYCRFCFRREQVGPSGEVLSEAELDRAISWITSQPQIFEVILTGGDPLILSEARLRMLVARVAAIPHVGVLRIHTRVPIVAPERVTAERVAALRVPGLATWVGVHVNHADELDESVAAALGCLVDGGIPVVSQSVLLRGVNDDVDTLVALFRSLVRLRVKPYYLHHGDLAPGTAHFRVPLSEGQKLVGALRGHLSGLCQPTYVLDIPGGFGKVPAAASWLDRDADGDWLVRDWNGAVHRYPDAP